MKHALLVSFLTLTTCCFSQNIKFKHESFLAKNENHAISTINFNVPAYGWKQKIDSVSFEGSLIIPKNGFDKVVIIKPGTGINTRNTHTPLAEELLNNHIAVFRYDERGTGNSGGVNLDMHYPPTEMATELAIAFKTLKKHPELKDKKFGLIGHSLGGIAILDALKLDISPDFLVLLATPVVSGKELFRYQLQHPENIIHDYFLYDTLAEKEHILDELSDTYLANQDAPKFWPIQKKKMKALGYTKKKYSTRFPFLLGSTTKDLLLKDHSDLLKQLKIPLFYMIGSQDILVDPIANPTILLGLNNPAISTLVLPNENHFFAEGESYDIHEEPKQKILNWIKAQH